MSEGNGIESGPVRLGSPELNALLARIAEGASERERDRTPPYEQIKWIRDAGLGRLRIPVEEGGAGASLREFFQVLIDLAAADSNVAHILRAHFWFVEQQLQSKPSESRSRWLALVKQGKIFGNVTSEQSGQKVGLFFETKLTPNANGIGYRINGQKYYSTGSLYSDWIQIYASTPAGTIAGATIPVDREGLTIKDDWDGFGQRLTGTGTTILDDVYAGPEEVADYGSPFDQPPSFRKLALNALRMALAQRRPPRGLIHHSDRGSQGRFKRSSQHNVPAHRRYWFKASAGVFHPRALRGLELRVIATAARSSAL
jgi:alkylation response protein AidB-like acyl-CoA dehydrogenase